MKKKLLDWIVCPECQVELDCQVTIKNGDEIETGVLCCPQCRVCYPIRRGIPRFVSRKRSLSDKNDKTIDAFGWQWQEFKKLHDLKHYEAQFLDWIYPIKSDFFEGKVVLDAGCGMGRFSLVSSKFGAKIVLAIDASDSVEAARDNTRDFSNIHVIQGDIHNLPLRRGTGAIVDFIFSIGVLHHLVDPKAGFNALIQHLIVDGTIFVWIYGYENNRWLIKVVNPLRTKITSRLSHSSLYVVSWLITAGFHPILKIACRMTNLRPLSCLSKFLPYSEYLAWLGQYGFRHNHHVVFDHLVAPIAFYLHREEFEIWFKEADMQMINISWRNKNSWRGHARFNKEKVRKKI